MFGHSGIVIKMLVNIFMYKFIVTCCIWTTFRDWNYDWLRAFGIEQLARCRDSLLSNSAQSVRFVCWAIRQRWHRLRPRAMVSDACVLSHGICSATQSANISLFISLNICIRKGICHGITSLAVSKFTSMSFVWMGTIVISANFRAPFPLK